jgi:hypothetical protein
MIKNSRAPGAPESEAISLVAAQWASVTEAERLAWRFRAEELNKASSQMQQHHRPHNTHQHPLLHHHLEHPPPPEHQGAAAMKDEEADQYRGWGKKRAGDKRT